MRSSGFFVNSTTHKLVFPGIVAGSVGDPKSNAAKVKEAVEKIVSDYSRLHGGL